VATQFQQVPTRGVEGRSDTVTSSPAGVQLLSVMMFLEDRMRDTVGWIKNRTYSRCAISEVHVSAGLVRCIDAFERKLMICF
jgi:hypothetical protein